MKPFEVVGQQAAGKVLLTYASLNSLAAARRHVFYAQALGFSRDTGRATSGR
jgi:hypothetical protein